MVLVDYPLCPNCRVAVRMDSDRCWNCGQVMPVVCTWVSNNTEEPCPHCGKTRSEEGGGER